jgi:hypothetical protein
MATEIRAKIGQKPGTERLAAVVGQAYDRGQVLTRDGAALADAKAGRRPAAAAQGDRLMRNA